MTDTPTTPVPTELLHRLASKDLIVRIGAIDELRHLTSPVNTFEPSEQLCDAYLDWWDVARRLDRDSADDLRAFLAEIYPALKNEYEAHVATTQCP